MQGIKSGDTTLKKGLTYPYDPIYFTINSNT